ncbi:MAG: hypothetical protein HY739_10355 [Desulfobacterales bacterium]|nr:hypothetical protein [Desulfobacterales bacterium]
MTDNSLAVFENYKIRRHYDEQTETWYFSVVDIMAVLLQQSDYQTARKYWNKLKERLKKEGSESVTNCHQLKMEAGDGKKYLTDAADPKTLLRLIQSVPSPKAEPIKLWLAKVGYERLQNMRDHMNEAELIFTALAELSTRQIAESVDATGMVENADAGKKGGKIAKKARLELESKTGKSVITSENYLPPAKKQR